MKKVIFKVADEGVIQAENVSDSYICAAKWGGDVYFLMKEYQSNKWIFKNISNQHSTHSGSFPSKALALDSMSSQDIYVFDNTIEFAIWLRG